MLYENTDCMAALPKQRQCNAQSELVYNYNATATNFTKLYLVVDGTDLLYTLFILPYIFYMHIICIIMYDIFYTWSIAEVLNDDN